MLMTYGAWGWATTWLAAQTLWLAVPLTGLLIALHSSLQHEAIHGHPFATRWLNTLLISPSLTLVLPYLRFRATHLEHHRDSLLTDPYDDPETNYLDPVVWERLRPFARGLFAVNNTLIGRLLIGPIVGHVYFVMREQAIARSGEPEVLRGWLWYLPAVTVVLVWVWFAAMPLWAYALAAYLGLSVLKLRTFLEHQAHESARGRTVVIEDRGLFAFLFLNNNYHVVHHMHPKLAWYALPARFRADRDKYLRRNHGYYYRSYAEVIRRHLWRPKDPVAHPLWRSDRREWPMPAWIQRGRAGR